MSVSEAGTRRPTRVEWRHETIRVLVSAFVGVNSGFVIADRVPSGVPDTTDIVGIPSFTGFDPYHVRNTYVVFSILVPVITVLAYLLWGRVARRWGATGMSFPRLPSPATEPDPELGERGSAVVAGFTASVLAVQFAVGVGWSGVAVTVATVLTAVAVGIGAMTLFDRTRGTVVEIGVIVAAVLSVAMLFVVSRATSVVIVDAATFPAATDVLETVRYPWLPLWVAAPLAAGVALALRRSWRVAGPRVTVDVAARYVVGSVAVFMLTAELPGLLGNPSLFDAGERLAGAELLVDGNMPWRDFLAIHGLMEDSLFATAGYVVFEDSWWGFRALIAMIARPLFLVGLYLFAAALLRRCWAGLAVLGVGVVLPTSFAGGYLAITHHRLWLLYFVFVLVLWAVRTPTPLATGVLTAVMAVFVITVPEVAFIVPAVGLVLVASDLHDPANGRSWPARLARTRTFVVSGLIVSGAFVAVLAGFGVVDDYLYALTTFSRDHELTGTGPINYAQIDSEILIFGPPVLVIASMLIAGLKWRYGRITKEDLAVTAVVFFQLMYYWKFLARPDRSHVLQAWVGAPLLGLYVVNELVIRLASAIDRAAGEPRGSVSRPRTRTAIWASLVALLMIPVSDVWGEARERVEAASDRFAPTVPDDTHGERLGYVHSRWTRTNGTALDDLRLVLTPDDRPWPTLFDFTNSPALYHYLLDIPPVARYYHISTAIRDGNQTDLIAELELAQPDVIVWSSAQFGLGTWDGISNPVRHYLVSAWILGHYEPWAEVGGQLLLTRVGTEPPADLDSIEFAGPVDRRPELAPSYGACAWGETVNRLPEPAAPSRRVEVVAADGAVTVTGWAATRDETAARILVLVDGEVATFGRPFERRADIEADLAQRSPAPIGYSFWIPFRGELDPDRIQVIAVWSDETYTVLSQTAGLAEAETTTAAVVAGMEARSGPPSGIIDDIAHIPANGDGQIILGPGWRVYASIFVLDADASSAAAVRLASQGFVDGPYYRFTMTNVPGDPERRVLFTVLPDDEHVTVPVGSCALWAANTSTHMYLLHDSPLPELEAHAVRDARTE